MMELYNVFKTELGVAKICIAQDVTLREAGEIIHNQQIPEVSANPDGMTRFVIEAAKTEEA